MDRSIRENSRRFAPASAHLVDRDARLVLGLHKLGPTSAHRQKHSPEISKAGHTRKSSERCAVQLAARVENLPLIVSSDQPSANRWQRGAATLRDRDLRPMFRCAPRVDASQFSSQRLRAHFPARPPAQYQDAPRQPVRLSDWQDDPVTRTRAHRACARGCSATGL